MTNNALQNSDLKNEIMIYREIIYAIDIHCKAMELAFILYIAHILNTSQRK